MEPERQEAEKALRMAEAVIELVTKLLPDELD